MPWPSSLFGRGKLFEFLDRDLGCSYDQEVHWQPHSAFLIAVLTFDTGLEQSLSPRGHLLSRRQLCYFSTFSVGNRAEVAYVIRGAGGTVCRHMQFRYYTAIHTQVGSSTVHSIPSSTLLPLLSPPISIFRPHFATLSSTHFLFCFLPWSASCCLGLKRGRCSATTLLELVGIYSIRGIIQLAKPRRC